MLRRSWTSPAGSETANARLLRVVPFLHVGKLGNILIPDVGRDVPFIVENYRYRDPLGRVTVTFVRRYQVRRKPSRFDATMVFIGGRVLDYLGTRQHLAVDLDLRVAETRACISPLVSSASTKAPSSPSGSRCSSAGERSFTGFLFARKANSLASSRRHTMHPIDSNRSVTRLEYDRGYHRSLRAQLLCQCF